MDAAAVTNEQILAEVLDWASEREVRDVMANNTILQVTKLQLMLMMQFARTDSLCGGRLLLTGTEH